MVQKEMGPLRLSRGKSWVVWLVDICARVDLGWHM